MSFETKKLTLVLIDLAGYHRLYDTHGDLEVAQFLDAYFHLASDRLVAAGGSVVKYLGDAVLAQFAPQATAAAVDAVVALRKEIASFGSDRGIDVVAGANIHLATVIAGPVGPAGAEDVLGKGVNHLFLMGGGSALRISEPVYRQLASQDRDTWTKRKPPAVYLRRE